ncbi:hypothetical protein E2C01_042055 [Portunus trituberculatus]|uniref:Uncharacterized protein n=1 Tax=Portunus trituberculatus TaxID=210409 RepID=A0A5B7FSC7_PORTR|nr:hypothetical protein [Portunus trituberculatus]
MEEKVSACTLSYTRDPFQNVYPFVVGDAEVLNVSGARQSGAIELQPQESVCRGIGDDFTI